MYPAAHERVELHGWGRPVKGNPVYGRFGGRYETGRIRLEHDEPLHQPMNRRRKDRRSRFMLRRTFSLHRGFTGV